jgi:hypothetical protein
MFSGVLQLWRCFQDDVNFKHADVALPDVLSPVYHRAHCCTPKIGQIVIYFYFRQGNGHERDFIDNPDVYIMDVYNSGIYPRDVYAKSKI